MSYLNSKYPKGHAIKRYLCWSFGRLRTGLKLIVSHGELVEPRLVTSAYHRDIIIDLEMELDGLIK